MKIDKILQSLQKAIDEEKSKNSYKHYEDKIIEKNNLILDLEEKIEKMKEKYNKLFDETQKLADDNIAFLKEMRDSGERINWDNVECYKNIKAELDELKINNRSFKKDYYELDRKYEKMKEDLCDMTGCYYED